MRAERGPSSAAVFTRLAHTSRGPDSPGLRVLPWKDDWDRTAMKSATGKPRATAIHRIAKVLLVATAVLIPVALIVVGPDQVRTLQPLPPTTPLRIVVGGPSTGNEPTVFTAVLPVSSPTSSSPASSSTSSTLSVAPPPVNDDTATSDATPAGIAARLSKHLHPVADPEALPEELRAAARDWNEVADRTAAELLDILARPDAEGRVEMDERMRVLINEYIDAWRAFDAKAEALGEEGQRMADAGKPERRAAFQNWYQLYTVAGLAVYRHNHQWIGAAACCQVLGRYGPASEPDYWWNQEQVFLRSAGIEGRFELAGRSFQKAYSRWAVDHPEAHEVLRFWDLNP